jgi:hypothetical protein
VESTGVANRADSEQPTHSDTSADIEERESAPVSEKKSKRKTLKELRKTAASATQTASNKQEDRIVVRKSDEKEKEKKEKENLRDIEINGEEEWGGIKLHVLLQKALVSLNFNLPTPIQTAAIPIVATGKFDLVGAAETGSGVCVCVCV